MCWSAFDHADDAGVYQIRPTGARGRPSTFSPRSSRPVHLAVRIADDAHALSECTRWAGVLSVSGVVCFPEKGTSRFWSGSWPGGLAKMMEAGCTVIGGHSIRDDETKFGFRSPGSSSEESSGQQRRQPGDAWFPRAIGRAISTAIKQQKRRAWIDAASRVHDDLNKRLPSSRRS